jgi:hypothetical protein
VHGEVGRGQRERVLEGGQVRAVRVHAAHRDHLVEAGRELVVEMELVPHRRHQNRAPPLGVGHRAVEAAGHRVGAEAHAHDARAAVGGVDDPLGES